MELCRQILAYSGKGRFVIDDPSGWAIWSETCFSLLQSSPFRKATLNLNLKEPPLPPLHGDPGQIRQVIIMNLVIAPRKPSATRRRHLISTGLMQCSREYLCRPYL